METYSCSWWLEGDWGAPHFHRSKLCYSCVVRGSNNLEASQVKEFRILH